MFLFQYSSSLIVGSFSKDQGNFHIHNHSSPTVSLRYSQHGATSPSFYGCDSFDPGIHGKKNPPRLIKKIVFWTVFPLAPQTDRGDNRVAVMLIVHNSTYSQVDHMRYVTYLYFPVLLWSSRLILNKAHDCSCLAKGIGE